MSLSEPSPKLLDAATRIACSPCNVALANWASGGYHLSCRACEIRAVADEASAASERPQRETRVEQPT